MCAHPGIQRALVLESVDAYLAHPDPSDLWLIESILPVHGRLLLAGDAKLGKSLLALQMAFCLACGRDFLGFHVPGPVNVVYLQYEMRRRVFRPRVQQMRAAFPDHVDQRLRLAADAPELVERLGYSYRDIPVEESLRQLGTWPDVVVIDPLIYWLQGDENSNTEMRDFLLRLDRIAEDNFAMVIVHHAHKPYRGQALGQAQARGASVLSGWTESNLTLNRVPGDRNVRTLRFDVRASGELDEVVLELDADTLTFVRRDEGAARLTSEAVVELCLALDPGRTMSQRQLAQLVAARTGSSERRIRSLLAEAGWHSGRRGRPRGERG